MAITVKHQPSAKTVGGASYTAGRGARRERNVDRARADEKFLLQFAQSEAIRLDRFNLTKKGMESREGMYGDRDALAREQMASSKQQYEDAPGRRLQEAMQQQELLKEKIRWEYSEKQLQELEKIQGGRSSVRQGVAEGKYTPDEGLFFEKQFDLLEAGLIPVKNYRPPEPTPQEVFDSRIITDQLSGERFMWDGDKKFTSLKEDQKVSFDSFAKIYDKTAAGMTVIDKETGKITVDEDAVLRRTFDIMEGYESYIAGEDSIDPAVQTQKKSTQNTMDDFLQKGLAKIEEKRKGKGKNSDMVALGQDYMNVATKSGANPAEALKSYMDNWYAEWDKRGFFRDDVVPNPNKFISSKIKSAKVKAEWEKFVKLKDPVKIQEALFSDEILPLLIEAFR